MNKIFIIAQLCGLICLCGRAKEQPKTSDNLAATNDARPIETLTELLEDRFGIPITFEDPKWDSTDLILSPDAHWRQLHPGRAHEFPLRSAEILDGEVSSMASAEKGFDRLNELRNVFASVFARQGEYGKRFDSIADEGVIHVQPRVESPLDLVVTVKTNGTVTGYEALDLLCKALAKKSNSNVEVGMVPINAMNQQMVSLNETEIKGRVMLTHLLRNMRPRLSTHVGRPNMSWKFLYSYDSNLYVLNLRGVNSKTETTESQTAFKAVQNGILVPNASRGVRVNTTPQQISHP